MKVKRLLYLTKELNDFNNILTAILGNTNLADILLQSGDIDKARKAHANIEKATLRAKDLALQLLTFAKGGIPVKKTCSIGNIVKEASEFALKSTNVKCNYFIADNLWGYENR